VAGRKPVAPRVFFEVVESQRCRLGDEQSEHTPARWAVSDLLFVRIAESDRDEPLETRAGLVEDPEGRVAGVDQGLRLLHEVREQVSQLDVGRDHEDRAHEAPELLGVVHPRVRHAGGSYSRTHGFHSSKRHWQNGLVTIRVFLLDDHELVREGIRSLLESDEEIEVVGEASTGAEALARVPLAQPDVAILDVRLDDGKSGIEVCRDLRSAMPDLVCLMLTSFPDDEAIYASVMAGAAGFVLKQIKARDLIDDVKKVATGASLMDPRTVARVIERIANPPQADPSISSLSPQEARILDQIAEGKTNKQIAEALFLSENTVKNYITSLLRKLRVTSRTEAAIYATKLKGQV